MSVSVNAENNCSDMTTEADDNEQLPQFQVLSARIKELEKEKKEIHENYNTQRGRMHKLYLQKDEELMTVKSELEAEVQRLTKELDEAKSQLCIAGIVKENEVEEEKRKAQAEIATLNQLVQDTVEATNTSQGEVKKLRQIIKMLETENKELKGEKEGTLLGTSNVLSVTKTLARKVVGQLGSDNDFKPQDNLEDSMRKAQEDAEVLRSLVIPLEEEIQALKEKLRVTDERLRKYEPLKEDHTEEDSSESRRKDLPNHPSLESPHQGVSPMKECLNGNEFETSTSMASPVQSNKSLSPSKSMPCDMCSNYETQLVSQQQITIQLRKQKEALENNMERFKEDLVKETEFRKEMEDKWNEKKEEHKVQVAELKKLYENASQELKDLQMKFTQMVDEIRQQLSSLTIDREKVKQRLNELQRENDSLVGKYSAHSEQLKNEYINLPDNVEDLQELLLKSHEELIAAKVAKETKEESEETLKCEIQLLRDQIQSEGNVRTEMENALAAENSLLKSKLDKKEKERLKLHGLCEKLKATESEQGERIQSLEMRNHELSREKKHLEENVAEMGSRVASLQTQLYNSETVQQDFVRLSQSLQIQLEKIRGADTDVRWQHKEDVDDCPSCRCKLSNISEKVHCRHCGQIFCSSCLSHTVLSGPNRRPSRVCQVCHTLLNRDTAPYFSQEPPHTPD